MSTSGENKTNEPKTEESAKKDPAKEPLPPPPSESELQMADMFDNMSLKQKLAMLKLFQDSETSHTSQQAVPATIAQGQIQSTSSTSAQTSYIKVEVPSLPVFSGEGKGHASYNLWKYELKCLMENPEVSRTSIWQAVRKSAKGLASEVLMCLGEKPSLTLLLEKFDSHFGNTRSLEQLLQEFYLAQQDADQSCTAWGCKLEELMLEIRDKGTFSIETTSDMLRSKFWTGLKSERTKAALRHRFDAGDTFEDLLKKARITETEVQNPQAVRKVQTQQQNVSETDKKLDDILRRLSALDGRIQKIENKPTEDRSTERRYQERGAKSIQKKSKYYGTKGICWNCGDKQHKMWDCPNLNY